MKQWSREEIMKGLRELVTEITSLEKSEDFDGKSGGVRTTTEDACIYKDIPPFNHDLEYGEMLVSEGTRIVPDHSEMKVKEMYIYGIHRDIYRWLEERGWYPEWQDRVTLFFWKRTEDSDEDIVRILKLIKSIMILMK
ncbi:MAG: hypothetical protein OPY07_03380 [Nitrosopumilus sp.]|nr:hypothetical protein [Nitrosopumilus sp.]